MDNTDAFKAALERAKSKAAAAGWTTKRRLPTTVPEEEREEFEFTFLPTHSVNAMEVIAKIEELRDQHEQGTPVRMVDVLQSVGDYLDSVTTTDTQEHIAALVEANLMGLEDLLSMMREVVEHVSGRPTGKSSSSDDGSSPPGPSSTAPADSSV